MDAKKVRVDYWEAVGLLHDVDFELFPEDHCFYVSYISCLFFIMLVPF